MGSVLVTGGAGFLGKYIARSLADAGEQVVITYRRYFRAPELLLDLMESQVKAARCDVLDLPELSRVIRDHSVDSIVHLAHISNYEAPIYTCMQTNVLGTINLMEAAAIASVKKVTYCSSSHIAVSHGPGGSSIGVEDETVPIASRANAVVPPSKKVGEILSLFYGETFGTSVIIVRPGLIYGPYGEAEVGNLKVLRGILEGVTTGKPVDLPNIGKDDQFGLVYVRDVAAGTALVHRASSNQHRVYCLDGEKLTSWGEIAEIINEFVPGSKITFGKSSQPARGRLPSEELNITSEFGFKPEYGMREGLRELIEWYQKGRP
ncbi:NAD-dependent epimerase/dehydratase family protein [Chloroflexota bacterium]